MCFPFRVFHVPFGPFGQIALIITHPQQQQQQLHTLLTHMCAPSVLVLILILVGDELFVSVRFIELYILTQKKPRNYQKNGNDENQKKK